MSELAEVCDTFWGSHGCDKPAGHAEVHQCGEAGDYCSQMIQLGPKDAAVRYAYDDDGSDWSEWLPSSWFS